MTYQNSKIKKSASNTRGRGLRTIIILLIIAAICATAVIFGKRFFMGFAEGLEFQKGMAYITWSEDGYATSDSDASLVRVKETGTEWVSILVTWYQTNPWSGDIHRTIKTPSDESIIHVIRKAHELGMKVMLKPHLDLLNSIDGNWRGEIGSTKEADWDAWFHDYTNFLMHYVDIAKKEKVEMFCVGTELSTTATVKGYLWRDLIKKTRARYNGKLTYAAHWDNYMDIRFWDLLDYVGINAYFPLTEEIRPTYDQLKEGWAKWAAEMEEFQKKVNKPIIFPEVGCNSADGTAIRPWEHVAKSEVNLKLQEDYYKVLLEIFWDKPWFYGLYWWYWGINVEMGGKYNRGFTPQNKPAEDVIREWFAKPVSREV